MEDVERTIWKNKIDPKRGRGRFHFSKAAVSKQNEVAYRIQNTKHSRLKITHCDSEKLGIQGSFG
jgi:hypothetical protein